MTIDQFRRAWYAAHVSHDPDYDRDRHRSSWRGTALTARTWQQIIERTSNHSRGSWQTAAVNHCLPSQL